MHKEQFQDGFETHPEVQNKTYCEGNQTEREDFKNKTFWKEDNRDIHDNDYVHHERFKPADQTSFAQKMSLLQL